MLKDIYKVNNALKIDYQCRHYCVTPYPGHPHGCPNYNVHSECPPNVKRVEQVFDVHSDLFFVVEQFDLAQHVVKMQLAHPDWTTRQLRNLLYWQGGVRKRLTQKTCKFINDRGNRMIYTLLPEAMGIMVIDTALAVGIQIERTPVHYIHKIALVGYSQ